MRRPLLAPSACAAARRRASRQPTPPPRRRTTGASCVTYRRADGSVVMPIRVAQQRVAIDLPIRLEGQLALVLAQEVQELLVVRRLHVEEAHDDLVAAARFLEALAHQVAHVGPRNVALHVERIHGGPEALATGGEALVEIVDHLVAARS